MADGLIIDEPTEDLDVFECPNCGQTIDVSADECRFCGAKINHEAAEKGAHLLAKIDQACNDASILRYSAVTAFLVPLGTAFGLLRQPRFFVLFGFQNVVLGFCVLVLLVSSPFPIWSLRWWTKKREYRERRRGLSKRPQNGAGRGIDRDCLVSHLWFALLPGIHSQGNPFIGSRVDLILGTTKEC
jgi:hypothetical protein